VAEPDDDQVVRGDDHRVLPARPGHKVGLTRHRELVVAIEPEEAAVDWAPVGLPRRRERADKFDEALRQDPLTIPDSILQVEVTEPRPVPSRGKFVTLGQEVAVVDRSP
jgi:hypothetical protein